MGKITNTPIVDIPIYDIIEEYKGNDTRFDWHKKISRGILGKKTRKNWERKKTRALHRLVVDTFFEIMMRDIICNNVQFDFRIMYKVYLSLLIADRDRDSYLYKYRIENNGHDFIPYCINSNLIWMFVKRYYLFRLGNKFKSVLIKEVKNGRVYDPAPKVDYKKKVEYGVQYRLHRPFGSDEPNLENASKQSV